MLKEIIGQPYTAVFYESPHRIVKTLEKLADLGLTKRIMVARELTKKFETVYRGDAASVRESIQQQPIKGEFVVVISSQKEVAKQSK